MRSRSGSRTRRAVSPADSTDSLEEALASDEARMRSESAHMTQYRCCFLRLVCALDGAATERVFSGVLTRPVVHPTCAIVQAGAAERGGGCEGRRSALSRARVAEQRLCRTNFYGRPVGQQAGSRCLLHQSVYLCKAVHAGFTLE